MFLDPGQTFYDFFFFNSNCKFIDFWWKKVPSIRNDDDDDCGSSLYLSAQFIVFAFSYFFPLWILFFFRTLAETIIIINRARIGWNGWPIFLIFFSFEGLEGWEICDELRNYLEAKMKLDIQKRAFIISKCVCRRNHCGLIVVLWFRAKKETNLFKLFGFRLANDENIRNRISNSINYRV